MRTRENKWMLDNQQPSPLICGKVQRLEVKVMGITMFETDVEKSGFVSDVKKYIMLEASSLETKKFHDELLKKYQIANETFHYRVRSLFGKGVPELRKEFFTPSKEVVSNALLRCDTVDDVWDMLKIPSAYRKGLFDRYYGISNFVQAKSLVEQTAFTPTVYSPNIKDNEALLAACCLGDGSFDSKRCSIRIEHGYKQEEWLRTKVRMLKKSFPFVAGEDDIKKRVRESTGYVSFAYYSKTLKGKAKRVAFDCLENNYEQYFTPLFLWVLFLDDGCKSKLTHQICYGRNGDRFGVALQDYLDTFGIESEVVNDSMSIVIRKKVHRVRFSNLLLQFKEMTPETMQYKMSFEV